MRKFKITVDNEEYEVEVEELKEGEVIKKVEPATSKAKSKSVSSKATAPKQSNSKSEVSGGGGDVVAPLPGVVIEILVNEGDTVNSDDVVLILEAMKMENKIQAHTSGTVTSIEVREGDSVNESDIMIKID